MRWRASQHKLRLRLIDEYIEMLMDLVEDPKNMALRNDYLNRIEKALDARDDWIVKDALSLLTSGPRESIL